MQEKELSPVQQFYIWLEQELKDLEQNGPKVKRGRKPSKKQYFTYINEKAIVAFNKETNQSLRNKVFKEYIYKPFDKLVENLIHTFKFFYFDVPYTDVKAEVVAFLDEKIHKFTEGKGKAFSYFSVVAKNYLIQNNYKHYNRKKSKAAVMEIDNDRDVVHEVIEHERKSEIQDFLIKTKPDIIHIHGLWRPIHILFIYVSSQLNIPLIIQPHGMLLDEAIKAKSKFNYLIKLFIIKIYKQLLTSAIFIAVTDEEKKSILKYFRTKNIEVITNPFETTFKVQKQLKKNISYFGRYSPHKNLDLIIKSFLESKLGKDWKLTIYGIDDDSSYKKNILNLIKNSNKKKRIYIKKPIFDKNKKFKKMSESFLNVLMSKSEILSLSVLEGLSVGTRSLVNNEIKYPKKISNLLYNTKPEKKLIAKKLNQITKNFSNKYRERINIKNQFKKIYFSEISQKKYNNLTMGINKLKKKTLEINFFNISIANGLNSFLVPFLVVIYGLINSKISAEIGIIEGTIIYLTQIFSSNTRTILLNEKNDRIFDNFISFRSIISVVIFLIFTFFLQILSL